MKAFSTDTRHSMDGCPPLEDIAAFIDGTLSEREHITEHLARCESCYEVFAGAVHFQEDTGGGGVIPFPLADTKDRAPRRIPRWLLLAASVVLVAGIGFFTWRLLLPPKITLAGLAEPIEEKAGISDVLYEKDVPRGFGEPTDLVGDRPPFLVGVHLIDLRLSVKAGNVNAAANHLQDLGNELKEIPFLGDLGERCSNEYLALKDAAALEQFARKLPGLEKEIEQYLTDDPSFPFGLWIEGGRLAAKVKSPDFFNRRDNRRFLSSLLKNSPDEGDESLETVPGDLKAVEEIWDRGDFSEKDYDDLAKHFESVIKAYESSSSELDDLPLSGE